LQDAKNDKIKKGNFFHKTIKSPGKLITGLCREEGIRTLDALLEHTRFPGVRLRPLGHLSKLLRVQK
jgi:hypothetical protein